MQGFILFTLFSEDASSNANWWNNYWWNNFISLGFGVLQAIIICWLSYRLLNKVFVNQRKIGQRLSDRGITSVTAAKQGGLTNNHKKILFGEGGNPYPYEVDLCFISGCDFFRDYQYKLEGLVKQ